MLIGRLGRDLIWFIWWMPMLPIFEPLLMDFEDFGGWKLFCKSDILGSWNLGLWAIDI
jgi:hypothetical protein